MKQNGAFAVALVVVVLALGSLEYYTYDTLNNQISNTKADLNAQITELQGTVASLQNTVASQQNSITSLQNTVTPLQNEFTPLQSEVASLENTATSLQNTLTTLQTTLTSLQNTVTQNQQAESASIQQIQSTLQGVQTQVGTIQSQLSALQPQEPISTLVITKTIYDSTTKTENITVKNTFNGVVYAQLQVVTSNECGCGFWETGFYNSGVTQFNALSTTLISFSLNQIQPQCYNGAGNCGTSKTMTLTLMASATQLSQTIKIDYPT